MDQFRRSRKSDRNVKQFHLIPPWDRYHNINLAALALGMAVFVLCRRRRPPSCIVSVVLSFPRCPLRSVGGSICHRPFLSDSWCTGPQCLLQFSQVRANARFHCFLYLRFVEFRHPSNWKASDTPNTARSGHPRSSSFQTFLRHVDLFWHSVCRTWSPALGAALLLIARLLEPVWEHVPFLYHDATLHFGLDGL